MSSYKNRRSLITIPVACHRDEDLVNYMTDEGRELPSDLCHELYQAGVVDWRLARGDVRLDLREHGVADAEHGVAGGLVLRRQEGSTNRPNDFRGIVGGNHITECDGCRLPGGICRAWRCRSAADEGREEGNEGCGFHGWGIYRIAYCNDRTVR